MMVALRFQKEQPQYRAESRYTFRIARYGSIPVARPAEDPARSHGFAR